MFFFSNSEIMWKKYKTILPKKKKQFKEVKLLKVLDQNLSLFDKQGSGRNLALCWDPNK